MACLLLVTFAILPWDFFNSPFHLCVPVWHSMPFSLVNDNKLSFSMAVVSWSVGFPYLHNYNTHILKQLWEQFQGPKVYFFARQQFHQWTTVCFPELKSASLYLPIILPPEEPENKSTHFFQVTNNQICETQHTCDCLSGNKFVRITYMDLQIWGALFLLSFL